MPLFSGKKNMSKNIKTEMAAGKPQKQSIAIAYNMAKRNGKKLSKGGSIGRLESDRKDSMLGSDAHVHTEECLAKGGMCYGGEAAQMAEGGRLGDEDANGKEMLNKNRAARALRGDDWDVRDEAASNPSSKPMSEPASKDKDVELMERDDERDLLSSSRPGNPGAQPKAGYDSKGTEDFKPTGDEVAHLLSRRKMMADGGRAELPSQDNADLRDEDSLDMVSSIMNKRKMMAEGGQVEDGQSDVSRNSDEDYNVDDQLGWNALRKENYSESPGLDDLTSPEDSNEHSDVLSDEDAHDMVDSIRKKLKLSRKI